MSKENDELNTILFTMKKDKERSIQKKELNFNYFNNGIKDSIFLLYSKIGFNTFSPFKNKILSFKKDSKTRMNLVLLCTSSLFFTYPFIFLSFYLIANFSSNASNSHIPDSSVVMNFLNNPFLLNFSLVSLPIGLALTTIFFLKKQKHIKDIKGFLDEKKHSEVYNEKVNEYSLHLISLLNEREKRLSQQDLEYISEIIYLKEYLIDETYKMNYEEKGFESHFKKLYDYNLNQLLICRDSKVKNLKENNLEEKLILAEKQECFEILTLEQKFLKIQNKILDKK